MIVRYRYDTQRRGLVFKGPVESKGALMPARDDYSVHEALDRSECCSRLVADWLMEHPVIMARKDWMALAEKAHDALFELNQAIGREHL